jgi:hypothetical protein
VPVPSTCPAGANSRAAVQFALSLPLSCLSVLGRAASGSGTDVRAGLGVDLWLGSGPCPVDLQLPARRSLLKLIGL